MAMIKVYRVEMTNRGLDDPLIHPYDFALEFGAATKEDAIDTVSAILDGRGMIIPPQGTRFELVRLLDKAAGNVVLE